MLCESTSYGYRNRDWCEDGVHRSYFESGAREAEVTFQLGKRQGASQTWWANGKPESVEAYADDKLTRAKRWGRRLAQAETVEGRRPGMRSSNGRLGIYEGWVSRRFVSRFGPGVVTLKSTYSDIRPHT